MHTPSGRTVAVRFAALWLLAAGLAPAEPSSAAEGWRLTLKGALPFVGRDGQGGRREDLEVELVRSGNGWSSNVWGSVRSMPSHEHLGRIESLQTDGAKLDAVIRLHIEHSRIPCVLGGDVRVTLSVSATDSAVTGVYRCTAAGDSGPDTVMRLETCWGWGYNPYDHAFLQALISNRLEAKLVDGQTEGAVTGRLRPPLSPLRGQPAAVEAGEHPRLFFRRADVARLRERAATPEGARIVADVKALLERSEQHGYGYFPPAAEHSMAPMWAAGYGLLYQLTGDASYARRAAGAARGNMFGNYYYGGGWIHPYTLLGQAAAYDLCYDAWDPDTLDIVYNYLVRNIEWLARRDEHGDILGTEQRYLFANRQDPFALSDPLDDERVKFRAAAAVAALALLYDAPRVFEPVAPANVEALPPADGYEPWFGVPVVAFEDDVMPREWLVNGPFLRGTQDEALQQVGGFAGVRPEPGTLITVEGTALDFRRYLPAGYASPRGPTIYERDCSRYWSRGTGGGYRPGIALIQRWQERLGRRPAINVCLYTVLRNDRERVVQALPNWRSRSSGNRMWINGRAVRDGELLRLLPGLYPLTCDIALQGGYTGIQVKLREYTPERYRADVAVHDGALDAFGSRGLERNTLERDVAILVRSVRRYLEERTDADGWGGWRPHEAVLPLTLAVRNVLGVDMAEGTGLSRLMPIAARMRGHDTARTFDVMVSQGAHLMPADHLGVARGYLDAFGPGIKRPFDGVIALATHPIGVAPESPASRFALAGAYPGSGVFTFNSGWSGGQDFQLTVHTGAGDAGSFGAGAIAFDGRGTAWAQRFLPRGWFDTGWTSTLDIEGAWCTAPGRVLRRHAEADGSGSISVLLDAYRYGTVIPAEPRPQLALDRATATGIRVVRAVGVDYSGRGGAEAVLVTVDRIAGAGRQQKTCTLRIGAMTADDDRGGTSELNGADFSLRPNRATHTLHGRVVLPADGVVSRTRSFDEQRHHVLQLIADYTPDAFEKLERDRLKALSSIASRDDDTPTETDAEGETLPPDVLAAGESLGDGVLDSMLTTLKQQVDARRFEADKQRPPVTLMTVMTVQKGAPPAIRLLQAEPDARVQVGDGLLIRFDGETLTFGRPQDR